MTMAQITKRQERDAVKFTLAKQIRALLDDARKAYGASDWEDDEIETHVAELVFEEG